MDLLESLDDEEATGVEDAQIFIAPPDSHVLTDEDSGEDEGDSTLDNLSRRQLSADAEIRLTSCEVMTLDDTEVDA